MNGRSRSAIWRLVALAAPFWRAILLATLLGFATIASSIGLMTTSAYIIARAALHPSIAELQLAIVGVRFFGIARGGFRYLERLVSHDINFRLLARLRVWFYRHLEPLAPARLLAFRSGDLLSRIVEDIESLEDFYVRVIAPPLVAVLVALLAGALVHAFAPPAAYLLLVGLVLAGLALPTLTRRLGRAPGRQLVQLRADLSALLVDHIQGAADLLAFGRERVQLDRIAALSQRLTELQLAMARIGGLQAALSGLIMNLTVLAALLVAIPLVRAGALQGVLFAVIVLAIIASFEAVLPLPLAFQYLEKSLAAGGQLFEIVDAEPAVPDPPQPVPRPGPCKGPPPELVVQQLSFRYTPNGPAALDELSFVVRPGCQTAIVGASGAGKTTLVNLLLRFWDYQQGSIQFGGHELRRYHPEDVRQLIGVVSQDTHLFNGTIRDNLLLARPDASNAQLDDAAGRAQLTSFIQSLPEGYDSWIGEQGLRLSGGERQRIAIARAILKESPFLLLDEFSANLDAITERNLMRQLQTWLAGDPSRPRSALIITHRLLALGGVDEILVLERGRLVERGRHHELVQLGGAYARMWQIQQQWLRATDDRPAPG